MDISGKVALVTGGASGIGKAIVEILLKKQAKAIFVVDVDENGLKQTRDEFVKKFGEGKVEICKCDVSSKEQMEDCFKNVMSRYGQLHIMCNNAGVCDELDWEKTLAVNVSGVIIGSKLAIKYMKGEEGGGGVIINTGSLTALALYPSMPVYTATKCAVVGFTRQIATFDPVVVKKKIRVNVICPGGVNTPIRQSRRVEEQYQATINNVFEDNNTSGMSPQDVAHHLVKLIEEPHHGQTMLVENAETCEIVPDETVTFRETHHLTEPLLQFRDSVFK